ncbi:prenyltransferase/squalene oxidase repeat-containing protein [Thermococcus sp.]|uniref:prenyltransferase/squalene oxidase repeat-containing protein n=1 Tax=Thermococcus sp. TaxID=35749 RepID=UPI002636343B|nr:prenyltransferase/squalene oxidase repeat-containing protein [Thermococcus sp.]
MRKLLTGLLIILMVVPLARAGTIGGSAAFLVSMADKTTDVQKLSLTLLALSYASKPLGGSVNDEINSLALELINAQNPDGGWGYRIGQASDVLDTGYAVVALVNALQYVEADKIKTIRNGIDRAVSYLLSAEGEDGWGYVPDTEPSFYPTAIALWALGEYGYSYVYPFIKGAVLFLNYSKPEIPENEALALKVIAYHAVDYTVPEGLVERIIGLLYTGDLTMKERAMLTYALELVRPFDFNTARLVTELEGLGKGGANYTYWFTRPSFYLVPSRTIETTAYALMAISIPAMHIGAISPPENPYWLPCDALLKLQNPDGGWPIKKGEPSQEMATYYALKVIDKCYHSNETVQKAINWTESAYGRDMNGTFSTKYFYALETLLSLGLLNESERRDAIEYIFNSTLRGYDYIWGNSLGPQPYETALAVKALLDLGVPETDWRITKAISWILSVGNGRGWGIIVRTRYYTYTLGPNVPMTIEILDILKGLVPAGELKSYADWLVSQRINGGWAPFKAYYDSFAGRWVYGRPTVYLTVRATDLLSNFGYNFTNETLSFVLKARDEGRINDWSLDTAMAIDYLCRFKFIPPVTLYEIENAFLTGENFTVIGVGINATEIVLALRKFFGDHFKPSNGTSLGSGYYVVVAPYGAYNISNYNPYVGFRLSDGGVILGNYTAPMVDSIAVVPGSTAKGMVLFVLYGDNSRWMAEELFTTGFVKYLRGNAMLIVNENGRIRQLVVG